MAEEVVVALCTAPAEVAEALARRVVDERLCACVNIVPGVTSVFRWEGAVDAAQEHLLVAKTTAAAFPALRDRLAELHPYDVPEVIALPVTGGLDGYLGWVADSVGDRAEG